MKQFMLLLFSSMFVMAGCNSSTTEENPPDSEKQAAATSETVTTSDTNTDSGMVELRIPASYYEEKDAEAVIRDFESSDVKATQNADSSFTLVMTSDMQMLFKVSIFNTIKTTIQDTVEEGDYPSIKAITYNEELTKMEIIAEENSFNVESDGLKVAEIANLMTYYQIFDNVPENNVQLDVSIEDEGSGNVFEELTFN
ncbi:hypothetical protein ACXYMX_16855 [Sporosarcina sp. CAU 1771]